MFKSRLFPMQRSSLTTKKAFLAMFLVVFLFGLFILPQLVAAQTINPTDTTYGLENVGGELSRTPLMTIIGRIIQVVLGILGIIMVLLIIYAGWLWMTAAGEEPKIEKAKKIITSAIIGFIIILSAFSIVTFILRAIGGATGGGGGGGGGGRPSIDPGRWGLGRGPIESVYPAPDQKDVPINTVIVVTFKVPILASTICEDADTNGACTNEIMKNVRICQMENNACVDPAAQFGESKYTNTVVTSNDGKTFVFTLPNYLGGDDKVNRIFQVTLQEGIRSVQESDRSIFNSLLNKQYSWSFTTNGQLDLDPPEIIDITGVYPYPDSEKDVYGEPSNPEPRQITLTKNDSFTGQVNPSYTQPTSVSPSAPEAKLTGIYGGPATGDVIVSIDASADTVTVDWPGSMDNFSGTYSAGSQTVNIGPYGLTFALQGQPGGTVNWTFSVTASQVGDKVEVLENGNSIKTYVFGQDIPIAAEADDVKDKITESSAVFETCGNTCLKTKVTGVQANKYSLKFTGVNNNALSFTVVEGTDPTSQRTVKGQKDPFRNTIFQITFNEPINPLSINYNSLSVKREGTTLANTDFTIEFSNQYQTIGLKPTASCGVTNSCGDEMTCWPVEVGAGVAASNSYEVSLKSAALINSADPHCSQWGGADDGKGRCQKTIDGKNVFYPLARQVDAGLVDMATNAFNGSFNTYDDNGKKLGIAEGQSGNNNGTNGLSGRNPFDLNSSIVCTGGTGIANCFGAGNKVETYGSSVPDILGTPASGWGDDFVWKFFVSSEIDTKAPLVKTINPVGAANVNDRSLPVQFGFDRLMRSSTLCPGWNYGSTDKEKSQRYLILETLTNNQIPVGYWVTKDDRDENGDGWADYSDADIAHNNFDPNVEYGPLVGSGVQSITQNCFLPAGGPKGAQNTADGCRYNSLASNETTDCVRDSSQAASQVKVPNPASFSSTPCGQISGASACDYASNKICMISYYKSDVYISYLSGSWVISKDKTTADGSGRTGCCFGQCLDTGSGDWKTCAGVGGTEGSRSTNTCEKDPEHASEKPGTWIITKGLAGTNECCLGIMH